ncbi:MAG TPA: hypothetical protein VFB93_14200 [Burkholderiales bacterium]|nr:hypothetical protein [Burkholderiales bacterium]
MANLRRIVVRGSLLAAAITTGIGLLAANPDPPADPSAGRAKPAGPASRADAGLQLELPARRGLTPAGRDLFGTPAPPPAPRVVHEPVAPPPPSAPPLPFTLVGSFEAQSGETVYYLAEAEKVHVVKPGEAVNELYRLEAAAADQLELLYLPLAIKQTLVSGAKK